MLGKKMFRDIRFNKSQFITIFLMVFIGILAYSGVRSYMEGMQQTGDKFYSECNLQDIVSVGANFTKEDLSDVKKIEHVKNAERKLTVYGSMDDKSEKTLQLNFIESNEISKFHVVDGEGFNKDKEGIWVDSYFAERNDIKVGNTLKVLYDGVKFEEKVLGLILVPDHVYDIKDESTVFPDHIDYGFTYLSINEFPDEVVIKNVMKEAGIEDKETLWQSTPDFDPKDSLVFNYLLVDIDEKENKQEVKNEIESKINSAIATTYVEDTTSYMGLKSEIEEGEVYCPVFAGLFLFIAVLSVITTMTRVVKKQRIQIGTLKALGYKNSRITMHYVGFGFWISLIATTLALIFGPLLIGRMFVGIEFTYFEAPNYFAAVPRSSFIVAVCTVLAISLITYLTCRSELMENPAETLRVEMPKVNAKSLDII